MYSGCCFKHRSPALPLSHLKDPGVLSLMVCPWWHLGLTFNMRLQAWSLFNDWVFGTPISVKYSLICCLVEGLLQMSIPSAFSASRTAFAFASASRIAFAFASASRIAFAASSCYYFAFCSLTNSFARFSSTYFETVARLASASCIFSLRAKFSSWRVLISNPYVYIESRRVRFSSLRVKISCVVWASTALSAFLKLSLSSIFT